MVLPSTVTSMDHSGFDGSVLVKEAWTTFRQSTVAFCDVDHALALSIAKYPMFRMANNETRARRALFFRI